MLARALDDPSLAVRQVVVVGAGYDSRARRFAREGVRYFKVDHPDTQARKQSLMNGSSDDVVRVPLDLSRARLLPALEAAGLDREASTVFIAEGLVHYLSRDDFRSLLDDVAAGQASRVLLLSFIRTDMVPKASSWFRMLVRAVRVIPVLTFAPDEIRAEVERTGLHDVRIWDYALQLDELVPRARGRRFGVSQDVLWACRQDRAGSAR